jgi:hypothetical protein
VASLFNVIALSYVEAAVEHGLPQKAVEIARPLGFPVTNSMASSRSRATTWRS